MDEQIKKLLWQVLRKAKKQWRIGVFLSVLCGIISYSSTWFVAEKYTASETISLQDEQTFNSLLKNIVAPVNTKNNLNSAKSIISSSTVLERVAIKVTLLDSNSTQSQKISAISFIANNMNITQRSSKSSIVTINFTAHHPKMAYAIVTELSREFVYETLNIRQKTARLALEFLAAQRIKTKKKLSTAKNRLKEYKKKHFYSLPQLNLEGTKNIFEIKKSLIDSKTKLSELNKRISLLRETLTSYNPKKIKLESKYTELNNQLKTYASIYTEKHPKMRQWRAQKKMLQANLSILSEKPNSTPDYAPASISIGTNGSPGVTFDPSKGGDFFTMSRIMQEQELILEKEMLEAKTDEYTTILSKLKINIEQLPEIEKNIGDIKNEISLLEHNYRDLNKKFLDARHSIDIAVLDASSGYSILTPATVPLWPHFPVKKNFLLAGLAFGLLIFLFILGILEFIRGRILDRSDVEDILECRYLGSLPVYEGE